MKFRAIAALLEGVPYTDAEKGRLFYEHVMDTRPTRGLELGFAHGASAGYFAAALDELGGDRRLTCVDRTSSRTISPTLEETLARCGLAHRVEIVRVKSSYTWYLHREIADGRGPRFDFCFIDGGKNWTVDGAAFFMVDKLLRQGGSVIFDDYSFTYADASLDGDRDTYGIVHDGLEDDERALANVEAIFRLLVMQHPSYSNFRVVDDEVAFAEKRASDRAKVDFESRKSVRYELAALARRLRRRLSG
jgi:predicted O-methyltransferase YrrM